MQGGHRGPGRGIRTAEEVGDGRKRLTYEAEMVHDFVFFADPDFVETWRGARPADGPTSSR